jgi:hypothetical protein
VILSPSKKFIFIHVPKAAGTSVHGALRHLDVFHKVRRESEAVRRRHAAANRLPEAAAEFRQHTSARAAIEVLGREAFDAYYSFCFVRNPFDTVVSWFHYRLQNPQIHGHAEADAAGTFDAYVHRVLAGPEGKRWVELQSPYVTDESGAIAVRFVGRYENLATDFAAVVNTLALEALPLDRFNESTHAPWASLYTPAAYGLA